MNRRILIASILLYFVAVVKITGGLYDIFLPGMPTWHASFLGTTVEQVDARVEALDLAQMDAIGGLLLAIGVVLVVLVTGPLRRGESWAQLTILILIVIGDGGNALGMYQVGSPYYVPIIEILITVAALGISKA